jgi:hypothetical protein
MPPELTSKETPIEVVKNLNGDVRSAQSALALESFFFCSCTLERPMTSERGRK